MTEVFKEPIFREYYFDGKDFDLNIIKKSDCEILGKTKITVEQDSHDGVKIILKKDADDSIKEIKFMCSCGQSKSIILDYSE